MYDGKNERKGSIVKRFIVYFIIYFVFFFLYIKYFLLPFSTFFCYFYLNREDTIYKYPLHFIIATYDRLYLTNYHVYYNYK